MEEIKKLQAALLAKNAATNTAPSAAEATVQATAEEPKKPEVEEISATTAPSVSEAASKAMAEETMKVEAEAERRSEEISATTTSSLAEAAIEAIAEATSKLEAEEISATTASSAVEGATQAMARGTKKVEVDGWAKISATTAPSVPEATTNAMAEEINKLEAEELSVTTTPTLTESAIQAIEEEAMELEAEDRAAAAVREGGVSRMPRSLEALYLRPLKRAPKYGLPVCDLQLRSYSVRPLEFFADFAVRAAYYLGLAAAGPVPLPRQTERWTVPKSHFVHKKSQENFSRTTLRRLIQIKDGHPETVQIWLAFLQKHAYYGIGMKANVWEFSKAGKLTCCFWCCVFGEMANWLGDRRGQEYG